MIPRTLDPPRPFPKTVTAAEMLAGAPPPPLNLVVGALPVGELGLLIGSDGSGKSDLALQIALGVATGSLIAGGAIATPDRQGDVLYVGGEDDSDHINRKLRQLNNESEGLNRLKIACLDGRKFLLIEAGRQAARAVPVAGTVDALTTAASGSRLIILDPLVMFHGVSEIDNSHQDDLARLLIRIARDAGAAILAVHHTSQAGLIESRDDHQAGRGATALASAARAVWVLRRLNQKEQDAARKSKRSPETLRWLRGAKASRCREQEGALLEFDTAGSLALATPLGSLPTTATAYARVSHPAYEQVQEVENVEF